MSPVTHFLVGWLVANVDGSGHFDETLPMTRGEGRFGLQGRTPGHDPLSFGFVEFDATPPVLETAEVLSSEPLARSKDKVRIYLEFTIGERLTIEGDSITKDLERGIGSFDVPLKRIERRTRSRNRRSPEEPSMKKTSSAYTKSSCSTYRESRMR